MTFFNFNEACFRNLFNAIALLKEAALFLHGTITTVYSC